MHLLRRGDHALDVFHAIPFKRVHELLLLHLCQAVVPGVAVQIPELLHVLVCHGLGIESSWRGIGVCRLEECGGAIIVVLADVGGEWLLRLIVLGYLRV